MTARVVLAALTLAASAWPAAAHAAPAGDVGGFHSVLALGQGETVEALDLAANQAAGVVPRSFVSQRELYTGIVRKAPTLTGADLGSFYKDSGFGQLPGGAGSTTVPRPGVTIVRDAQFAVPRISGATRADTFFGVGYATAQDRLFFMDVLRRTPRASTAELLGPSAAASDSARLGDQDYSEQELHDAIDDLPAVAGPEGAQGRQDFLAYVEGINAFVAEARANPTMLPAEYVALGASPRDWTLADTAAVAALLIGQFTVNGGGEAVQAEVLHGIRSRFGPKRAAKVYSDFRRLDDPEAPVVAHSRAFRSDRTGKSDPRANAIVDPGSVKPRNAIVSGPGAATARRASAALPPWARALARDGLALATHASNAVLVDRRHSVSGRALASMGPQVGYYSPSILIELEIHGPGIDVSGMVFPGAAPYPLIGHGIDFAWSGTSPNGDNRDTFAEELCNPDGSAPTFASRHYRYKGDCVAFTSRDQRLSTPLSPLDPAPPQTIVLRTLRSVHGPVSHYATVGGKPVALTVAKATNYREGRSLIPFMRAAENRIDSPRSFAAAFREFQGQENWFYVDRDNIAWLQSGVFPKHARGVDTDFPIWGTGAFDWRGFLKPAANPRATNPKEGYLVSWNNKEARGWRAPAGTWAFGPVHRSRLLERPLRLALRRGKLDLAGLTRVTAQAATADLRGTEVLSWVRRVIGIAPDADSAALLDLVAAWQAGGSQRRDLDGDNRYEHGAAIALVDAWWPRLVGAIFEPALGRELMELMSDRVNPIDAPPNERFFFDGWLSYVQKDLRAVLGRRVKGPLSRRYCGAGTLRACREALIASLRDAAADVRRRLGSDPSRWTVAATCPEQTPPICGQVVPETAGAVATPPFPFHNRGTFHQAVEVRGRR